MPTITGDSASTVYSNVTSVAEVTVNSNVVVSNAVISTVAISLFDIGANMVTCNLLSANVLSVSNVILSNLSVTKLTASVANVTTGNITSLSSNSATISSLSATSGSLSTLSVSGNSSFGNSLTGNSATFHGSVRVDGTLTANVLQANTITGFGGFGNLTAGNLTVTGSLSASNVLTDSISPLASTSAPLYFNTTGSLNMNGSTINFSNSAGVCSIVGGGSSIQLKASGQTFFYASTGKVGIKTSSPSYPLDVAGATNVQGTLTATDVTASNSVTTNAFSGTRGSLSSLTVTSSATMAATSVATLGVSGNAAFVRAVTGAAATYTGNLSCSGNVRTDTICPLASTSAPLYFNTTGTVNLVGSTINFSNSAGSCQIVGGGSSIALKASGQTFFYASTGKVGIKTSSPSTAFDVNGDTNITSTLAVSGLATFSGGATITGGLSSNNIGNLIYINQSALVVSIGQSGGTLNP